MTEEKQQVPEKEVELEKRTQLHPDKLAVVLVRGLVNVSSSLKNTLKLLGLDRKNKCVVIDNNPVNLGMVKKVKGYVTWGSLSDQTYKQLIEKRGEEYKGRLTDTKKKYSYNVLQFQGKYFKPYFRLNPPRKGFGRKGIKMPFNLGGGLGNREDKINDLIQRMI